MRYDSAPNETKESLDLGLQGGARRTTSCRSNRQSSGAAWITESRASNWLNPGPLPRTQPGHLQRRIGDLPPHSRESKTALDIAGTAYTRLGGGGKYPFPQWVWSYSGGWWGLPKQWKSNSVITATAMVAATGVVFNFSAGREIRHHYPEKWIPSMLWSRDFHDPEFVAVWKKQLEKEGREWIEPIPDWWPFKKSAKSTQA
ncbi:uncharacterized protein BJ171DRAFT_471824 [Polychytrium aggregatum]|uniref:uncharacterized protein n=1 Tax=Polychytrium aggregatum TaxID=110093 RepID=UPI0022FE0CF1|nr:uncharacterized protein BJ171DRAFT_471824 [Polychytrium aggregatum]KAI9208128.1 hypothetical protein BJ171DRAFT_471824 [Polychytrium aggregatum]